MSKNKPMTRIFNIDVEARRYYPKDKILIPAKVGIDPFNVVKMHDKSVLNGRCYTAITLKRA